MKIGIIGAGIIGLYLAKKLAEQGNEVFVFEAKKEIGNDVCSGLFSSRIFDYFPESKNLVENKIESALLKFTKKTIELVFSKQFALMSHFLLDKLAAREAELAGAKIILNNRIVEIPKGFDRIIGCDGPLSFTRKEMGLKPPNYRLGILASSEEKSGSKTAEILPTKNGFLWKLPRGEKTEYGVIEKPELAKTIFFEFLKKNKISGENLGEIKSKLIPLGLRLPKSKTITLCGDAAGITKPWSGGGVIWGLKATDILLKNFPDFISYRSEARKYFLPKMAFGKFAKNLVYFLGFDAAWIFPKKIKIEPDYLWKIWKK